MSSEVDKHISDQYSIKRRVGKGAYGVVWKAIDRTTEKLVAVKKIFDAFRNQTDAQRTFREIMFLREFSDHPNIIKLFQVHPADNNSDIYLIFEYMETDLHNVIKTGNILKDIHKRYIMYQLLKATKYIHSGNVIHRDQKPSNILLNSDCVCKVADFGLARSVTQLEMLGSTDPTLTDYVATRWYRAPEILVASKRYTQGIDMWSLGCILGEMLIGKPLFPGSSTVNQIERIMTTIPPPSAEDLASVCTGYGSGLLQRAPTGQRRPLSQLLKSQPSDGIDLVAQLLVFNPHKRLTAEEALSHPYVTKFHQAAYEISMSHDVLPPIRDDVQLSVDEYRTQLYELASEGALTLHSTSNRFLPSSRSSCHSSADPARIRQGVNRVKQRDSSALLVRRRTMQVDEGEEAYATPKSPERHENSTSVTVREGHYPASNERRKPLARQIEPPKPIRNHHARTNESRQYIATNDKGDQFSRPIQTNDRGDTRSMLANDRGDTRPILTNEKSNFRSVPGRDRSIPANDRANTRPIHTNDRADTRPIVTNDRSGTKQIYTDDRGNHISRPIPANERRQQIPPNVRREPIFRQCVQSNDARQAGVSRGNQPGRQPTIANEQGEVGSNQQAATNERREQAWKQQAQNNDRGDPGFRQRVPANEARENGYVKPTIAHAVKSDTALRTVRHPGTNVRMKPSMVQQRRGDGPRNGHNFESGIVPPSESTHRPTTSMPAPRQCATAVRCNNVCCRRKCAPRDDRYQSYNQAHGIITQSALQELHASVTWQG